MADQLTINPGAITTAHGKLRIEQFDVLIVGAGLSGIGAAYHLQTECPGKSFVILEARNATGGTWDLFRYPGIRSDSDMFTLGYRFRPWRESKAIADGPSILRYIRETAAEHGIDSKIRFGHHVTRACWSSEDARWMVEATDANGEAVRFVCNFLYMCSGYYDYSEGYMPGWPGMEQFRGQIVHPQKWPEDLKYRGKRIVVIGSGATAVTLVPAMTDEAAHVTMLQRSPTYIVARPSQDVIANFLRKILPARAAYAMVRWKNVLIQMYFYNLARRKPEKTKKGILALVEKELGSEYDVNKHFSPRYNPWDQRLCLVPDSDLFAAIRAGKASIVTDEIETFTETGLRLRSGEELEADIIVTATGLEAEAAGRAADYCRWQAGRNVADTRLQRSDVQRCSESRFRVWIYECLVDAEGGFDGCVRLPPAELHGRKRICRLRSAPPRFGYRRRAHGELHVRIFSEGQRDSAEAGLQETLEAPPELRAGHAVIAAWQSR